MDTTYTQGLMHFGKYIRDEGWIPLVCFAMKHGKCYSFHFYVMKMSEGNEDRFASFVFSTNQNVVRDSFTAFKDADEGNADFKFTRTAARYVDECIKFDLTKEVA